MPDQANHENSPQNQARGGSWLDEPRLQKQYTENELQVAELRAAQEAARREIEALAAAEFRPRSDEAADLRVGSGLHDRYLLLKGEPIGAIWKAGWAERLVDAVRQMELDPPEDWEATPEMEAALASDLMDIPMNEAHFATSEDPYGEIAAVLLGKGWRR